MSVSAQRVIGRVVLVMLAALFAATATSMLVARFAPLPEADRLLAGALSFPLSWILWVLYPLLSARFVRSLSLLAGAALVFAAAVIVA